jgi:hypothetical protein
MFRKSTLLAVAASAALGLVTLSPISASAHGGGHGGGGHGGGMHGGGHGGGGHGGGGHGGGGHGGGGHWGGHGHGGHMHVGGHYRWRVGYYHRPIWYSRPVVYTGYTVARPITPGPCTCLTKEYTPEGAVLFKDRCTNEAAMNPPAIAPQQSSEIVPQQAPVAR